MDESEIEKSLFKRIRAWYGVAPFIWNCLLLGSLLFIGSILVWFFWGIGDPEASGAIMVGLSIAAQTHYSRLPLRVILNGEDEETIRNKSLYKNMKGVKAVSIKSQDAFSHVWKLAKKSDFSAESFENPQRNVLNIELVVYRIDKRIEIFISAFAIFSTIIWGYAGKLFEHVGCFIR